MQHSEINDYDLAAINNQVNKWQTHGKYAAQDISRRSQGVAFLILENVFAADGTYAILEIHKLAKSGFFRTKAAWVIQMHKSADLKAPSEKKGCVRGSMLVSAIMEAELDMKHGFISVADFNLSAAAALR